MLQEVVKAIAEMAVNASTTAATPIIKEIDKRKDYVFKDKEGAFEYIDAARGPARSHRSTDLETVVEFAKRFKNNNAAIWYSRQAVVCLIDDEDRQDVVTLPLMFSEQFRKLSDLAGSKAKISQRDTILLLRSTFKDCLTANVDLIKQLRTVKVAAIGSTDLQRGKSSEGRTIAAEIGTQYEPPEYLSLSIPVFLDQIGTGLQTVQCVFEVDESGPAFQLFPLPAELERAAVQAEAAIRDKLHVLLGDVAVPVYYGTP